jgi:hypothetical protein
MPLDYTGLLGAQRPLERAIQGYQIGTGLEQQKQDRAFVNEQRQQQQQAVQAQQEQARAMQADLAALAQDPTAGYEEHLQMQAKYPALKEHFKTFFDTKEAGEKDVIIKQGQDIVNMLQTGNIDMAISELEESISAADNSGDIQKVKGGEAVLANIQINPEAAKTAIIQQLAGIMDPAQFKNYMIATGIGGPQKGAGIKSFAPVTIVNPQTKEKRIVIPSHDPNTGKSNLSEAALPEGFEISKETPEEKRAADIATVGLKEEKKIVGKGKAKRQQLAIESGIEGSSTLPNLKRARALLDTVKTGGINAASMRAKQLFGVEGADEGELSNRLGKAVLSQLRETFGAAFTEGEGDKLDRIEAGFRKSPEANKRLIDQLVKLGEKKSREGINAAVAVEDFETARRIKENMAFTLDVEAGQTKKLKFNPATGLIE